ncbi:ABC transporter ATP-binding protein [Kitasatospora nipponensis]|uniref:ABC transporter ATP-binding protein n=1 Tax=Kitasatospora nipponensis TaxID=258049 RepID=A0ABN1WHV8_9ACTN
MNQERTAGLRLLYHAFRPVRAVALVALGVLTVSVLATLAAPLLVQRFVDVAVGGGHQRVLVTLALGYLAVALVGGTARVAGFDLAVRASWRIAGRLRGRLLRHALIDRPVLEVESRPVGDVLERVEGNANIVGKALAEAGFRTVGNAGVGIGALIAAVLTVPAAGAGIALLALAVYLALARLARVSVRRWRAAREQQAELFGFVGDALAAREDLLSLGATDWAAGRTEADLAALYRTESRAYLAGRAFWPLTQVFFAVAFGLGFGFGLRGLQHGTIDVGTLTLIYLYVNVLQGPLEDLSSQAGQMQQMMAVLAIAARSLEPEAPAHARTRPPADPPPVPPAAPPPVLPSGPLEVVFEQVGFGYGEVPVLRGVSFTVPAGRSLGIVGPTGAGKSTVVNLLCGLAAPDRGRVLIGGVDASLLPPAEFARRLTVLSQRAHVFAASVRENVTLFDDGIPEARVWEVLERLDAAGWVRALPQGVHTRVGAGARTLSAGEAQVLAGARALVRPYSLLIVDEGASRMDPRTERSWAGLLETVRRDRTVVMVEHRLATLGGFDEVLTLDGGRVVAAPVPALRAATTAPAATTPGSALDPDPESASGSDSGRAVPTAAAGAGKGPAR